MPWQVVSQVPRLDVETVQVWWASPADAAPWMGELLDDVERQRHEQLRRQADRDRFLVGCSLLKLAAAAHTNSGAGAIRLTRTCPDCERPHGKPRLPGSGLELSLSHSGDRVAAAVARDTPVGVDVEQDVDRLNPDELARMVLTGAESAALDALPASRRRAGFLAYWTRKEAVLKATGDGLRLPLHDIEVSGPLEEPRLVRLVGRDDPISLHDLDAGAGHRAALAVIGPAPRQLLELDARALLTSR